MDVVRANIERIGGVVDLDSRASQGFLESELQALDQLLDLTDPVLLDLILERSQPEGDLDTPEIRALLTEIRAL